MILQADTARDSVPDQLFKLFFLFKLQSLSFSVYRFF